MEAGRSRKLSAEADARGRWRELRVKVGCMRGWVEDEEEEAERNPQQRQRWRGSQMQQEEAALEGRVLQENPLVERHHRRKCKQWRHRRNGRSG